MKRYEPEPTVILSCNKERVSVDDVVFLDISEDSQGRDYLLFLCPICNCNHNSLVFL